MEEGIEESFGDPIAFEAVGTAVADVHGAVIAALDESEASAAGKHGYFPYHEWSEYYLYACADYCNEVLGAPIDRTILDLFESCGLCWMFDYVCFASERPSLINRNP